ncbi:type II toxin-antitoxin system RelE/ParE family toxin [Aquamicrobium defluvii]|uniref:KluB n=1 Tax=Aquamicrobium defluvii TaxID=69279 RepID=A0A011U5H0_9HYPH|nr:type II toxin-antitoxin system RelE/ParE family toxin [Aquamicrobium defluvii]EXL01351.1 KluB [Aquamicrobium defluvii]EZQ12611.1 KluB [Halopseudomonas bauzanensis]TDR29068.1 plasmid stabilization system protein ParE [Aquamicrobium defluvii]
MAFRIERSEAATDDLELIFDFLITAGLDFGEDRETAFEHASNRVGEIERAMGRIADAPFQGTLRPELGAGIRNVTKHRAVIYFEVLEDKSLIRVLAIFFSGQDHQNRMLARMLGTGKT